MKYSELKNSFINAKPKNIYLFFGDDAYFREQGLQLIKNTFIVEPTLNSLVLSGEEVNSSEELLSQLNSYPFLSEYRLVAVREFYPKADFCKNIAEYFKNPNERTIFVILNSKKADSLQKLENVELVDCNKEDAYILSKWIVATCKKSDVNIDVKEAQLLCEYTLCEMARITQETKKLIACAQSGGRITSEMIEDLVAKDSNFKLYELTNSLSQKNFNKSMQIFKELVNKGNNEQYIYTSLFYHIRKLMHVAINKDASNDDLAKTLNEKPYAISKLKEQVKNFKIKSLKTAYDTILEGDYLFKSGETNLTDTLYVSIFKIMMG